MNSLKDKVAIITGASRGIGKATAELFASEGVKLVLTARQNLELLKSFKNALVVKLDLANIKDIDSVVDETIKNFGKVDIFVNNAAFFQQTDFELISEEELNDILNVDFKGPFFLLQKVFHQMKKQNKGKIINIASGAGIMGSSRASHYAACKAAIISLTKSLAKLGGPYNINVNAIAPGFIETDMIKDMLLEKREQIKSLVPLGKIGSSVDVARAVLFLASEKSDYITGQILCVNGGHCMV